MTIWTLPIELASPVCCVVERLGGRDRLRARAVFRRYRHPDPTGR
ncbi:hypothetical protein [Micromonospora eburnea]|nr:hypothetical protein [Micromonospora eburnea]